MQDKRSSELPTFGLKAKQAREQFGLTQQQMSDQLAKLGVKLDTSAITRIENGSREPRLREARMIAQVLRVSLDDLIPAVDDGSELVVAKLWSDLQDAHFGLVDAVYEFGEARRALNQALDDIEARGLGIENQEAMRAQSQLRAIADWLKVKADVRRRTVREDPPRDESIWDAEA